MTQCAKAGCAREACDRPTAYGFCVVHGWVWHLSETRHFSGNTPAARESWAKHATNGATGR